MIEFAAFYLNLFYLENSHAKSNYCYSCVSYLLIFPCSQECLFTKRRRTSSTNKTVSSPHTPTLDEQAQAFGQEWVDARFQKCGQYYISKHADGEWIETTTKPNIIVTGSYVPPRALTEADRLNGVDPQPNEWVGQLGVRAATYRRSVNYPGSGLQWYGWDSNYDRGFILYKQKGAWYITNTDAGRLIPSFNCSEIPRGLRDASNNVEDVGLTIAVKNLSINENGDLKNMGMGEITIIKSAIKSKIGFSIAIIPCFLLKEGRFFISNEHPYLSVTVGKEVRTFEFYSELDMKRLQSALQNLCR